MYLTVLTSLLVSSAVAAAPKYSIAVDPDVSYLFTNLHFRAYSDEFNQCMFRIERDNQKYHTCAEFDSGEKCQCSFLTNVDRECRHLEPSSNYWYMQEQINEVCSRYPTSSGPNTTATQDNNGGVTAASPLAAPLDTSLVLESKLHLRQRSGPVSVVTGRAAHTESASADPGTGPAYGPDVLHTMNFSSLYGNRSPGAMTVDCALMRALKHSASGDADKTFTRYSSVLAVSLSTSTYSSLLEIIKAVPTALSSSSRGTSSP
ncbi:Piso0_000450 [Millerozyma farinosa CBS 7064]|uniref:Piso0_000450 protein n=1 Tax=Pichia sorbitophila (strain ATCC MYA-4447 / BCRC 22081 / CBS 7064 / NBRC 10061 / NRRL Y-12695) TaxID=559304 RepID=G8YVG8_PICSO|nr:Piso0_000450 [Millerozyma farinosa CBS 7064]CCE73412.1 Piso0_000450 [Millerozyma farinosa CBS 7064]